MKWNVIQNINETPKANTVRLHPEKRVSFKAGQWFLLSAYIDGKKVKRAYSISSSPEKDYLDVTSKLSQNPHFSKMLWDLQPGEFLEAEGPFGKFTYESPADGNPLILIGAGSGIAPLISMARFVIDQKLDVNITILYSSKTEELIIFRDELDALATHPNITVHHTLTQQQWKGRTGRIDAAMIKDIVSDLATPTFYICGPPLMVNAVQQDLMKLGVEGTRIKTERYN